MGEEFRISEIKDNSGHEHDFIATVNGEVIGRLELLIEDNEAELRIHLLKDYQGKGYGTKLTQYAIERGLTYLNKIWLGFEEGNEAARKLYEKVGFKYTTHRMEICKSIESVLSDVATLLREQKTTI
jgi:ribosomal protein S18 acetylase RimI-like enzyme